MTNPTQAAGHSHSSMPAFPLITEFVSSLLFHTKKIPTEHPAQLSHWGTETETLMSKLPTVTAAMPGGATADTPDWELLAPSLSCCTRLPELPIRSPVI